MFIAGNRSLTVPVGWRDQRMYVLHRRLGVSTDRAHNVMVLPKKEIDIGSLELEATVSHAINGSLEARVGGNASELGKLTHIQETIS